MQTFFEAKSVAVVGVSNSKGNMGRLIVHNLMEFRYQGCIYLVGPKGGAFMGHKIYPGVLDIPDSLDLAAVLVPAAAVPQVLRDCGEKGIRRVVLESAGFRELGSERLHLEAEVLEILDRYRMRLIGPNCIGVIDRGTGLAVPFLPFKVEASLGRVAVVSQSGGVGAVILNSLCAENIGFSKFASIGNKLNVDETDLVDYLIRDRQTDIVYCYLEGIARGRRLMELAFASPKPILVHKSNNGASGAVIAGSHSASLSSDDKVVDAAFSQCGIHRTRDQREALNVVKAFALPPMKGNRLAVISRSGGHAVMAADAADEYGFTLPVLPEEVIRLVEEASRAHVIQFHNPLDLGDLFDLPLYQTLVDRTLGQEDIDGVLFIHNYQGLFDAEESHKLIVRIGECIEAHGKPVAVCVFTTRSELDHNRGAVSFPIFTDPREAVRALAMNRDRAGTTILPFAGQRPGGVDPDRAGRELEALPEGPVPPEALASMLSAYGIPLAAWDLVWDEPSALGAARRMGFPVALKTAQVEVLHKSDVGGVILDINDEDGVQAAYAALSRFGPRVLVQKMCSPGLEWLLGGRRDEQFGAVVVAGLGGIYVEVFGETGIRIGPVGREEAGRLVEECRGSVLLKGVRGGAALDRESLTDLIVRLSWLLSDFPELGELDLNPVRVYPEGCLALDWRAHKRMG